MLVPVQNVNDSRPDVVLARHNGCMPRRPGGSATGTLNVAVPDDSSGEKLSPRPSTDPPSPGSDSACGVTALFASPVGKPTGSRMGSLRSRAGRSRGGAVGAAGALASRAGTRADHGSAEVAATFEPGAPGSSWSAWSCAVAGSGQASHASVTTARMRTADRLVMAPPPDPP